MCDTMSTVKDSLLSCEDQFNSNVKTDDDCDGIPKLCDLPIEILIKIFSFLEPDFIRYTLKNTCQLFEYILNDSLFWKMWIKRRALNTFPPIRELKVWEEQELDWEIASVEMCQESKKWSKSDTAMKHVVLKDVHYASVDTIILVNKGTTCVSGGRDRNMALFNVLSYTPKPESPTIIENAKPATNSHNAHNGWVWDLAADNEDTTKRIYSASWDNMVKEWDLETGLKCINSFNCNMSALSIVYIENTIYTGLYSKTILAFDVRAGPQPISQYKPHKGPVLALETCGENLIASVSDDRTLAVWDRVAGKVFTSNVTLPTQQGYPVCVNWSQAAMYVGDSKGQLHCINPESFTHERSHSIWPVPDPSLPSFKVTSCVQGEGTVVVATDRREIKHMYNCFPPVEFATTEAFASELTQLQYHNGVMAIGGCDMTVELWVPAEMYNDVTL